VSNAGQSSRGALDLSGGRPYRVERLVRDEGVGRGSPVLEVRNPGGLSLDLLLDRAMDIGWADDGRRRLAWTAPPGFPNPLAYDPSGFGWKKTFGGGLLATCGLVNTGRPSVWSGHPYGLHGRIGHLPATNVLWRERPPSDGIPARARRAAEEGGTDPACLEGSWLEISADVLESELGGPLLVLRRQVLVAIGHPTVIVRDRVANRGDRPCPHMFRHHIDLGAPLISNGTVISSDAHPFTDREGGRLDDGFLPLRLSTAEGHEDESVSYLEADGQGVAATCVRNDEAGFQCRIVQETEGFPMTILWRDASASTNILGVEPSTSGDGGLDEAREQGRLIMLDPDETREYVTLIQVQSLAPR